MINEPDEIGREEARDEAVRLSDSVPASNDEAGQIPEQGPAQPPVNEYWVNNPGGTTPYGYGQGYRPPYQGGAYPPPPQGGQGFGPYNQQHPDYGYTQYQYNPNSGWQQPGPGREQYDQKYQWNFQDYDKSAGEKSTADKKKKNRGIIVFVAALVCVLTISAVAISAFGIFGAFSYFEAETASVVESSVAEEIAAPAVQLEIADRPQISESLPIGEKMTTPQVAKAVSPSVVGVVQYRPDMTLADTGEGSGIIMTADGYIITNAHVVAGGTDFKVILHDGTPTDAELIGADSVTDLAVLKIAKVDGLTPAVFGDSTQIEVGEQVIAIGNPGGNTLAGSVTQGIISAVNRKIPGAASMPINNIPLIQTDAAINPGNSGGALANEYGQVIGINSSKIVAAGFEGIGFAIPISEAKPIIDDIVKNGRVTGRVKLGIEVYQINEIDARNTGLQMGLRIMEIKPESDLNNTGVQKFDIITHINGNRIYTNSDLRGELDKFKPGDKVTLTLFRPLGATGNNSFDVTVELLED